MTREKRDIGDTVAAIERAIESKTAFMERVVLAEIGRDAHGLAYLMAEAVDMQIAANGLGVVGRDGRARVTPQDIFASHCLIAARDAWRKLNT